MVLRRENTSFWANTQLTCISYGFERLKGNYLPKKQVKHGKFKRQIGKVQVQ